MNLTHTIKSTGEILDFPVNNLAEVMETWETVNETLKGYEFLKDMLKDLISDYTVENGKSLEVDGRQFKITIQQNMTYDKACLRKYLDEDLMDIFLEPKKTAIDAYIKEHLAELGDASHELRRTMIPAAKAFQKITLERTK